MKKFFILIPLAFFATITTSLVGKFFNLYYLPVFALILCLILVSIVFGAYRSFKRKELITQENHKYKKEINNYAILLGLSLLLFVLGYFSIYPIIEAISALCMLGISIFYGIVFYRQRKD